MGTGQREVRVSLTMIVRDEESNLPACLDSVAGLFDETIVMDTGSTDGTKDIARRYGAQVSDFVWCDHFAAARNAALGRATGDYAFTLDADDRIDPDHRPGLRALLGSLRPGDDAGYVARLVADRRGRLIDQVRLFPLRPDVRWSYAVHELINPALARAGIPLRRADVVIRHLGYDDPKILDRKLTRNAKLIEAHMPRTLRFAWGAHLRGDREAFAGHMGDFARELGTDGPERHGPVYIRQYHLLACLGNRDRGEPAEALQACESWLRLDPGDVDFLHLRGELLARLGRAGAIRGREGCPQAV